MAEALDRWLVQVIQVVEPWVSTDIEKGARWSPQIAEQLEQSRVGIICLTRDNLDAPWILFEAGALSKAKDAYVCTFLLDLQAADVKPPLGQFQRTTKDKVDVFALVNTINNAVMQNGERGLTDAVLERIFERAWPDLSTELEHISRETVTEQPWFVPRNFVKK